MQNQQPPQPSPSQAVQLLDNVCASVQLSRADHVAVQQAVAVLQELVATPSKEKSKA
jgi:hypothetical protein